MRPRATTPTAQELQILKIVWRREAVTVRDVYEEMREKRKIAYTSVMTALKTLEQKGYLKAEQDERAYVYRAVQPKQKVIRNMVREFVERVFSGAAQPLVVHLLEDRQISDAELREIARIAASKK